MHILCLKLKAVTLCLSIKVHTKVSCEKQCHRKVEGNKLMPQFIKRTEINIDLHIIKKKIRGGC